MKTVFVLLLIFQLKHWLADYPLQRPWMLGKFLSGWKWIVPLAAHAGVHALFTFTIAAFTLAYTNQFDHVHSLAAVLAAFDFLMHFGMDRIKASPDLMGRWKPLTADQFAWCKMILSSTTACTDEHRACAEDRVEAKKALRGNTLFWYALGLDQGVHHLTHYAIIWVLVH